MKIDENVLVEHFFNRECGLLHLEWFLDAYWLKVTKEIFIPNLLSIHEKLVEKNRKENSKSKLYWGDADGDLYYIPTKGRKVIVFTTQDTNYLFILSPCKGRDYNPNAKDGKRFSEEYDTHSLHIRRFWSPYKSGDIDNLEEIQGSVNELIDSVEMLESFSDDFSEYPQRPSLELYRKIKFNLDDGSDSPRFYGDGRDHGYILSYNAQLSERNKHTKISHTDLELLATCYISVMADEVGAKRLRLNGY